MAGKYSSNQFGGSDNSGKMKSFKCGGIPSYGGGGVPSMGKRGRGVHTMPDGRVMKDSDMPGMGPMRYSRGRAVRTEY